MNFPQGEIPARSNNKRRDFHPKLCPGFGTDVRAKRRTSDDDRRRGSAAPRHRAAFVDFSEKKEAEKVHPKNEGFVTKVEEREKRTKIERGRSGEDTAEEIMEEKEKEERELRAWFMGKRQQFGASRREERTKTSKVVTFRQEIGQIFVEKRKCER